MEITNTAIRLLQRALNALERGTRVRRLKVDGRPGRKTLAAFVRFLAAHGREGEARLARAIGTLG
jgi:lysozyme family protein